MNDKKGNPIEIAAVVVWRVVDTAQALLDVDNYETLPGQHPDRGHRYARSPRTLHMTMAEDPEPTLRADGVEGRARMLRSSAAGACRGRWPSAVDETRLSHLGLCAGDRLLPGRAGSRPRRCSGARRQDRDGRGLDGGKRAATLSERKIVELDDERKAAMVSNLLVVLCADREAQPVVNTGSLYQ